MSMLPLVCLRVRFSMRKISLLLVFVLISDIFHTKRVDNICSTQRFERIFVGLDESGVLTAFNITYKSSNISFRQDCQLEIVTCPSCVISLTFKLINLNCHCGSEFNLFLCSPCRCDYVWITEPPYDETSGVSFCKIFPVSGLHGRNFGFKSKTRVVRVSLFYSRTHLHAFTVNYKSEPNRQFFFGTSQYSLSPNINTGFISSPFFPAAYPPDLVVEYVLTCLKHANFSFMEGKVPVDDSNCRVHLIFTDFQLASSSVIEFYDRSRCVGIVNGISFRPPIILSTTSALMVRFYALGQKSIGFKGIYSFISENILKKMVMPSTDCGGYVDNFGGTITMMKMVHSQIKLFDCIWLIKPLNNFFNFKSHLYLKVIAFLNFDKNAELQIRRGLTSESPILENLHHPVSQNFQEHIIPLESGYYVSLKAFFGPASYFAVTYAVFSQNKCFLLSEFLCGNFRCISKKLVCDGFDHCGDNSDELAICYRERKLEQGIGKWHINTPNYYFPKIIKYMDLKTISILIVIGLAGLIFIMSCITIILFRMGLKNRHERDLQNQMHSFSDVQDCLSDQVSIEDFVADDPPSYEPPPNYEEVIEIFTNRSMTCDGFQKNSAKQRFQNSSALVQTFSNVSVPRKCI